VVVINLKRKEKARTLFPLFGVIDKYFPFSVVSTDHIAGQALRLELGRQKLANGILELVNLM